MSLSDKHDPAAVPFNRLSLPVGLIFDGRLQSAGNYGPGFRWLATCLTGLASASGRSSISCTS